MALEQAHPGADNLRTILATRWRGLSACSRGKKAALTEPPTTLQAACGISALR